VPYTVEIRRPAEKELDALPVALRQRIVKRLLALEEEPRPRGLRKLSNRESYRLRVGAYRILLEIDDARQQVTIFAVGHRRDVYR